MMSRSWWQRVKYALKIHKVVITTIDPVEENFHSIFTSGENIKTSVYEIKIVGLSLEHITFKVIKRGIPHIDAPGTTPSVIVPFEPGSLYRILGSDFQYAIANCAGRLFDQCDDVVYELVSSPENSNQTNNTKPSEKISKPSTDHESTVDKILSDIKCKKITNDINTVMQPTLTVPPPNQGATPMPDTTTAATPLTEPIPPTLTAASVKPDDTQQKLVEQLKEIAALVDEKTKKEDRLLPTASDDVLTVSPGDILTTEDGRQGKLVLSSPDEAVLLIDGHYEVREWSKVKKIRFCPVKPKLFTNR